MHVGDVVIANDLLGVVIEDQESSCVLRDADGKQHIVSSQICHTVIGTHALANLLKSKVLANAKNKV